MWASGGSRGAAAPVSEAPVTIMRTRRWTSGVIAAGAVGATLVAVSAQVDGGELTTVLARHSSSDRSSADRSAADRKRAAGRSTSRPHDDRRGRGPRRHPAQPITSPSPTAGAPSVAPSAAKPTVSTPPTTTAPAAPPSGGACAPSPGSSAVVNVTGTGAKAGDSGDDTAAIQAALDAVPSGGSVVVPDGVYLINATRGVRPRSSTTLRLSSGAVLRAIATSSGNYNLIRIQDVSNVTVVGGTVEGDLGRHPGTDGQWGHGISITDAHAVTIDSVTATKAWGDGFYVRGTSASDITLCRVRADHNRRQGLSVTDVDGMVIRDSEFTDTQSEPGGAGSGIDLEPNGNQHVRNVQVLNNTVSNNTIDGISIGMNDAFRATSTINAVVLRGNTVDNNGLDAGPSVQREGILVSDATGVTVENNNVTRSHGVGIYVTSGAKSTAVRGNTVTGTLKAGRYGESGAGIALYDDVGTVVTGNVLKGNAGTAIFTSTSRSTISGNTVS